MIFLLVNDERILVNWKQVLLTKWEKFKLDDNAKINIRLHNYPESLIALKSLKAAYIGNANAAPLLCCKLYV